MTADSLWSFATAVYARAGVRAACLSLQDRMGADVNVLLFCLWLARGGQGFDACAEKALALSRDWQSMVVAPLRSCRRGLADVIGGARTLALDVELRKLRETVKAAELAAEKAEIEVLAGMNQDQPGLISGCDARATALVNLRSYLCKAGIDLDPLGESELLRIVDVAFSG